MATTKETAATKTATTPPVPLTLQQKFIKLREAVPSITQKAHSDGVKWHSESGGPWVRKPQVFGEADQLSFLGLNDMPQGEFWEDFDYDDPKKEGRYLIRPIASAARIYGKKLVAQEAFTHMQGHWSMYPSLLKFFGDKSFILGANFSILHTFTSSPDKYGLPGIEYFSGTLTETLPGTNKAPNLSDTLRAANTCSATAIRGRISAYTRGTSRTITGTDKIIGTGKYIEWEKRVRINFIR